MDHPQYIFRYFMILIDDLQDNHICIYKLVFGKLLSHIIRIKTKFSYDTIKRFCLDNDGEPTLKLLMIKYFVLMFIQKII